MPVEERNIPLKKGITPYTNRFFLDGIGSPKNPLRSGRFWILRVLYPLHPHYLLLSHSSTHPSTIGSSWWAPSPVINGGGVGFFFHPSYPFIKSFTLPETETNIAPENRPSQKEFHLPTIDFQGQFVGFRKGIGCMFSRSFW